MSKIVYSLRSFKLLNSLQVVTELGQTKVCNTKSDGLTSALYLKSNCVGTCSKFLEGALWHEPKILSECSFTIPRINWEIWFHKNIHCSVMLIMIAHYPGVVHAFFNILVEAPGKLPIISYLLTFSPLINI
jgi:hypothetical protein